MPITAAQPHASTQRHLGEFGPGGSAVVVGFDVRLCRTAEPGQPISEQDRTWPAQMRRIGQTHLRIWRLDGLIETADLLISELVTNGLQHGRAEVVGVRLWRTGTYVGIEVISGGGAQVPCPREAGRYDEGGRGLRLVGVLADAWGVTPDGARTWCLLAIAGGE